MKNNIGKITLASLILSSCMPGNTKSDMKGLNRKLQYGNSMSANDIVIFYGNETPDTPAIRSHYARIHDVLNNLSQSAPSPVYEKIKSAYENDIAKFPAQIRKDAEGLKKTICGSKNFSNTGLFIFTNELARAGKFEYCLASSQLATGSLQLNIPAELKSDFRYAQSPLSMPATLIAAGEAVRKTLESNDDPVSDHKFILISKSHGSSNFMITPKLVHKMDQLSAGDLSAHFKKIADRRAFGDMKLSNLVVGSQRFGDLRSGGSRVADISVNGLKVGDLKMSELKYGDLKVGELKVGDLKVGDLKVGDLKVGDLKVGDLKDGDLKVGDLKVGDLKNGDLKVGDLKVGDLKVGELKEGDLKEGDLAADTDGIDSHSLGITKSAFIQIIKDFDMSFSILFFESCDSELPQDAIEELKQSVSGRNGRSTFGAVYTSDKGGLSFETVDYGSIAPVGGTDSFSAALEAALDRVATK